MKQKSVTWVSTKIWNNKKKAREREIFIFCFIITCERYITIWGWDSGRYQGMDYWRSTFINRVFFEFEISTYNLLNDIVKQIVIHRNYENLYLYFNDASFLLQFYQKGKFVS